MGVIKLFTVHCDALVPSLLADPVPCPESDPGGATPEEADANARANGWTQRDGLDLCPFHELWHAAPAWAEAPAVR